MIAMNAKHFVQEFANSQRGGPDATARLCTSASLLRLRFQILFEIDPTSRQLARERGVSLRSQLLCVDCQLQQLSVGLRLISPDQILKLHREEILVQGRIKPKDKT